MLSKSRTCFGCHTQYGTLNNKKHDMICVCVSKGQRWFGGEKIQSKIISGLKQYECISHFREVHLVMAKTYAWDSSLQRHSHFQHAASSVTLALRSSQWIGGESLLLQRKFL